MENPIPQRIGVRSDVIRPDRVECIYAGTVGDTLHARALGSGRDLEIPLSSITRLERPVRKSMTVSGALIGAFFGATVGIGALASSSGDFFEPDLGMSLGVTALFTAIGALPGAMIGAPITSDTGLWEDIPLDRIRVGLAPGPDAIALGVTARF